jgi:hypothetical protein
MAGEQPFKLQVNAVGQPRLKIPSMVNTAM